jgi:hypothetical protein
MPVLKLPGTRIIDLTGQKFNRLTVVSFFGLN